MKKNILFLRFVLIAALIPVIVVCVFALPSIMMESSDMLQPFRNLFLVFICGIYAAAVQYVMCLYYANRALSLVLLDRSTSKKMTLTLRHIRISALFTSIFLLLTLPLIFYAAQMDDAPGLGGLGIIGVLSPLAIVALINVFIEMIKKTNSSVY